MRIAFVIQRFGKAVTGGAEMLCADVARRLAPRHQVTILTTTARSHESWANYYVPGEESVGDLRVVRFPITRRKRPASFRWRSRFIFRLPHSLQAERRWMHAQGPESPALVEYVRENRDDYDVFLFYSYRYYPSYYGLEAAGDRGVLVPTAEHDTTIYLPLFREFLRSPSHTICLTEEERKLIAEVAGPARGERRVIGAGIELPENVSPSAFAEHYQIAGHRYLLYVGRIIPNKGCDELFRFALAAFEAGAGGDDWELILIGPREMPIPRHPRITYLGRVDDATKFNAMAGARALIMSSPYESLSLVTLEAMGVGTPVLLNGRCEVLAGHSERSGGALAYTNRDEFIGHLEAMLGDDAAHAEMSSKAKAYIKSNYTWPKVLEAYESLFQDVAHGAGSRAEEAPAT